MAIRTGARTSGICLIALGLTVTGCGGSQDGPVAGVAEDFYAAVAAGDGAAACDLLVATTRTELEQSSGRSCPAAVLDEVTDVRSDAAVVEVFDTMAQVRWGDRAMFLSRMPEGWRVLAAGCEPRDDAPYSCPVKGG